MSKSKRHDVILAILDIVIEICLLCSGQSDSYTCMHAKQMARIVALVVVIVGATTSSKYECSSVLKPQMAIHVCVILQYAYFLQSSHIANETTSF